jgi:transcriptional regulator with XRE-family HTH domain
MEATGMAQGNTSALDQVTSRRSRRRGTPGSDETRPIDAAAAEIDVGRRLRELRAASGFSLRALAEKSQLNANTLSLIENGKTSPSVSTLQHLARALNVPITAFFETGVSRQRVIYQKAGERLKATFTHGSLEDLGTGLAAPRAAPFVVTLKPHAGSGPELIVHTGHELVFCLQGRIAYQVDEEVYTLETGDSLLFEAHLPHRWRNLEEHPARFMLVLCPEDARDDPSERHFSVEEVLSD